MTSGPALCIEAARRGQLVWEPGEQLCQAYTRSTGFSSPKIYSRKPDATIVRNVPDTGTRSQCPGVLRIVAHLESG